jgi:hypothetical protein
MTITLTRISSQYIPFEDRIRLAGSDEGGGTLTLWLTQRLLNRLVVPLCEGLEKQTAPSTEKSGSPSASSIPSVQTHLVQTFAQQKAVSALPQSGPVVPPPEAPSWLVDSVGVKHLSNQIRLSFKGVQADQSAVLSLTPMELRQWLGILFKQAKGAAWPTDPWPTWMEEATKPSTPQPARSLH